MKRIVRFIHLFYQDRLHSALSTYVTFHVNTECYKHAPSGRISQLVRSRKRCVGLTGRVRQDELFSINFDSELAKHN